MTDKTKKVAVVGPDNATLKVALLARQLVDEALWCTCDDDGEKSIDCPVHNKEPEQ